MRKFYVHKVQKPMGAFEEMYLPLLDAHPRKEDLLYYELGITQDDKPCISFRVFPEIGFKSCALTFHEAEIEPNTDDYLPVLHYASSWGSFIGFPTPNRVRDCTFTFHGETVKMEKFGAPRDAHGLAYDSPWNYDEPEICGECIKFTGWFDIDEDCGFFEAFPYRSRLTVTYLLYPNRLEFRYCVKNRGKKPMPYGICRHPFFVLPRDNGGMEILLDADAVYETTDDLLPTGKLLPVSAAEKTDLRQFTDVRELSLDTVFTRLNSQAVLLRYPERGLTMRIVMSEEFKNVVVFTSNKYEVPAPLRNMICVESQTCCTDAINMNEKGFADTGLLTVEAGQEKSGAICYLFEQAENATGTQEK